MPPSLFCARYMIQRQKTLRIIISPGQDAIQIVASKSNVPMERKIRMFLPIIRPSGTTKTVSSRRDVWSVAKNQFGAERSIGTPREMRNFELHARQMLDNSQRNFIFMPSMPL